MATTTNYSWTTPDDTALVKDGAAAIRSLGTAIDTTVFNNASAAIAKTIVDAKGDIIAATAADTVSRLAVGANNTVLTADSTAATGLKWATPAGGSNWSLLNTGGTALTGAATVTVSGISNADKIMVLVDSASSASINSSITIRLNTDTGSNYYPLFAKWSPTDTYTASSTTNDGSISSASTYVILGTMSYSATSKVNGGITLTGCNSSGVKAWQSFGAGNSVGAANLQETLIGQGFYNSASTISSISVFSTNGNLDAGTVYVYTSA